MANEATETESSEESGGLVDPVVMCCPECGSGDVLLCHISVRPHCNECKFWGSINFTGTMNDSIREWNSAAEKSGR